jgi:ATP-dependent DNA ligase
VDGFRALAHVTGHRCELVSRNGHAFKSWPQLAEEIAHAIRAHSAVLDGEICCLEADGRSHFNNLLFRREWPYFYAFDVLSVDGRDLRGLPLRERKRRLRTIIRESTRNFSTSITSRNAGVICFAPRAIAILKTSWRSGLTARIRRTRAVRRG